MNSFRLGHSKFYDQHRNDVVNIKQKNQLVNTQKVINYNFLDVCLSIYSISFENRKKINSVL